MKTKPILFSTEMVQAILEGRKTFKFLVMKITHYFLHISYTTKAKNRLYEEFEHYLKALNGKIIPAFELEKLKAKIEAKVKQLNTTFYRCNPIKIYFTNFDLDRSIHVHGTHVTFSIIPASESNVELLKD